MSLDSRDGWPSGSSGIRKQGNPTSLRDWQLPKHLRKLTLQGLGKAIRDSSSVVSRCYRGSNCVHLFSFCFFFICNGKQQVSTHGWLRTNLTQGASGRGQKCRGRLSHLKQCTAEQEWLQRQGSLSSKRAHRAQEPSGSGIQEKACLTKHYLMVTRLGAHGEPFLCRWLTGRSLLNKVQATSPQNPCLKK